MFRRKGPAVPASWRGLCPPEGLPVGARRGCWAKHTGSHLSTFPRCPLPGSLPKPFVLHPQPGPGPSSPHTGWRQQQGQLPEEGPGGHRPWGAAGEAGSSLCPLGGLLAAWEDAADTQEKPCLPEQPRTSPGSQALPSAPGPGTAEASGGNPENKQIPLLESKRSARAKRERCELGRECRGDRTAWAKPLPGRTVRWAPSQAASRSVWLWAHHSCLLSQPQAPLSEWSQLVCLRG